MSIPSMLSNLQHTYKSRAGERLRGFFSKRETRRTRGDSENELRADDSEKGAADGVPVKLGIPFGKDAHAVGRRSFDSPVF